MPAMLINDAIKKTRRGMRDYYLVESNCLAVSAFRAEKQDYFIEGFFYF